MVVALSLVALALWDRKIAWMGRLRWDWGFIIVAGVVGPWALAITVTTDGGFWSTAIGGDLAPKLAGGQESHGAPPGYYTLLSPILMYPASLLLPAAAVLGWRQRNEPSVRFALCWLIPTWIAFELIPTKLVHYTLPAYGAAAWLMASALAQPLGRVSTIVGIVLLSLGGVALCVAAFIAARQFGGTLSMLWAALVIVLTSAAVWFAAGRLQRGQAQAAALTAGAIGILVHGVVAGLEAPSLRGIWLSERSATAVHALGLDPRQDIVAGPIAVAGYAEPSLVFLLGTPIQLTDAAGAARALSSGRPAMVDAAQEAAVRRLYPALRPPVANVRGLNYSNGRRQTLYLHPPPPHIIPRTPTQAPVAPAPAPQDTRP
jgi:4-amino-4-deoxy-L-arabinose transferase-like glycosyltransferase